MIIRTPPGPLATGLRSLGLRSLGQLCLRREAAGICASSRCSFSTSSSLGVVPAATAAASANSTGRLRHGYFSANSHWEKQKQLWNGGIGKGALVSTTANGSTAERREALKGVTPQDDMRAQSSAISPSSAAATTLQSKDLPHRRRQKAKKEAEDLVLPPNASTTLAADASAAPSKSLRRLIAILLSLSKPRLTVLVVLTSMASYALYPVPELLSPSLTETPSLSPLTLFFLTTGTTLCSAAANTLNMLYEPKWDAMMTRTRNRPLVRGLISKRGALLFALVSSVTGTAALYYGVNPTVSFLGALNIAIYAGVYTPLKRVSSVNTWVGAVVGGIPPLMGWVAAAGQSASRDGDWRELLMGESNLGGWVLASLLVAWQFPHFMSLSWSIREEYKNAGYKMLCWVNPRRNGRVALRYSLLFFPICLGLCYTGVTEWSFAVTSTPLNLWLVRESYKFWRLDGFQGSARGLFWASVWHLPLLLVMAMVQKKDLWRRVWNVVVGAPDLDDEDDDAEWEEQNEGGEWVLLENKGGKDSPVLVTSQR